MGSKRLFRSRFFLSVLAFVFLFILFLSFADADGPVVVKIGKHKIFQEEFVEILNRQRNNPEYTPEPEKIRQQLDMLIEKKVFIKEAARRKLAMKVTFLKRVQSFWEQALILELLNDQGDKIRKTIFVSKDEISAAALKEGVDLSPDEPYSPESEAVINEIAERIKREKETAALSLWIDELIQTADIKVNNDILNNIIRECHEPQIH